MPPKRRAEDPLPTPATPGLVPIVRVHGAHEEILEGYGVTVLGRVEYVSEELAASVLSAQGGGKYEHAHQTTTPEE